VKNRPPILSAAHKKIAELADEATAKRLTDDNPAAILAGRDLA